MTKVKAAISSGSHLTARDLRAVGDQIAKQSPKKDPRKDAFRWLLAALLGLSAMPLGLFFFENDHGPFSSQRSAQSNYFEKSVAVLPFESLSESKSDTYFAHGVQDEILNNLAKIARLKIISRTSAMQYRGDNKRDLRQIASALGVANVVEGTVHRDGNHVRVSTESQTNTVLTNGSPAGFSANVTEIAYVAGSVCQQNTAGVWYAWDGTTWSPPVPHPVPVPVPSPPAPKLLFFGGIQDAGAESTKMLLSGSVGCYTAFANANGCGWSDIESTQGTFNWAPLDAVVSFCQTNKIIFRYNSHGVSSNQIPRWLSSLSASAAQTAITQWIEALAARYTALQIPYYNILNEPISQGTATANSSPFFAAFGGAGTTGIDWLINYLTMCKAKLPVGTKIGTNEYAADSTGSSLYPAVLSAYTILAQHGGLIDFIGLEGYGLEATPDFTITAALNAYGALGLPIHITELTLGFTDQSAMLARWQDLLQNVFIPNPHVKAILGPWNWNKDRANFATAGSELSTCWIIDDTVTPNAPTPTLTWLRRYIPTVISAPTPKAGALR